MLLAAAFIGGAIWAILLTMVHLADLSVPAGPACRRRGLPRACRSWSAISARLLQAPDISDAAWEAHARIHRRATREAIEAARTVLMDTVRARGAASNRAAQAVIRLETADQIFGGLIALSDLLEHSATGGAPHCRTHSCGACGPSS